MCGGGGSRATTKETETHEEVNKKTKTHQPSHSNVWGYIKSKALLFRSQGFLSHVDPPPPNYRSFGGGNGVMSKEVVRHFFRCRTLTLFTFSYASISRSSTFLFGVHVHWRWMFILSRMGKQPWRPNLFLALQTSISMIAHFLIPVLPVFFLQKGHTIVENGGPL